MVGCRLLTILAKHNKINEVITILNKVSRSHKNYNRELKDVNQLKFIDLKIYFSDFTVQSCINNVKSKIPKGINGSAH